MKKTIIQRLGDGTETPLEDEAMAWPTFDRIYRRQNQLRKVDQILVGRINDDDDNDDESVSTNGSNLGFDEEAGGYEVKIVQSSDERKNSTSAISRTIRSLMCTGKDESENHPICSIICVPPSRSASPTLPDDILNESPSAESRVTPVTCDSEAIQQSGESTYESPKAPEKGYTSNKFDSCDYWAPLEDNCSNTTKALKTECDKKFSRFFRRSSSLHPCYHKIFTQVCYWGWHCTSEEQS